MAVRFDVVIFDLGSTLMYFDGPWAETIAQGYRQLLHALHAQGFRLDQEAFQAEFSARLSAYYQERDAEFVEHTTEYVLRALLAEHGYPNVSRPVVRQALDAMYAVSQACWRVEDDAAPTLDWLHRQGYRLAVLSNAADDNDVQTLVDQSGLRPYFEMVLTSAAAGIRKPAPRLFELALAILDVPAGKAVMVGDTLGADILGARRAGISSVWITRRAAPNESRLPAAGVSPDATIVALAELPGVLQNWGVSQG